MPHEIHEAPLTYLIQRLSSVVQGIPFGKNDGALKIQALSNTQILGDTIDAVPDLLVRMDYTPTISHLVASHHCFVLECTFTQSNTDVMRKLNAYVESFPNIVAVSKITIKETSYTAPNDQSGMAQAYRPAIAIGDWMARRKKRTAMGPVTRHGFTFIDVTAIDVHIWVRSAKDRINVAEFNTSTQAFAQGVSISFM